MLFARVGYSDCVILMYVHSAKVLTTSSFFIVVFSQWLNVLRKVKTVSY